MHLHVVFCIQTFDLNVGNENVWKKCNKSSLWFAKIIRLVILSVSESNGCMYHVIALYKELYKA